MEAAVDAAQTDAQLLAQRPLSEAGRQVQTAQHFELDFLLESNEPLCWGRKAQGVLGTLPPCRFTISKRGLRSLTGESGG